MRREKREREIERGYGVQQQQREMSPAWRRHCLPAPTSTQHTHTQESSFTGILDTHTPHEAGRPPPHSSPFLHLPSTAYAVCGRIKCRITHALQPSLFSTAIASQSVTSRLLFIGEIAASCQPASACLPLPILHGIELARVRLVRLLDGRRQE